MTTENPGARVRANIASTIGNLMLQQIEMQAVIEDQAKTLAAAAEKTQKMEVDDGNENGHTKS